MYIILAIFAMSRLLMQKRNGKEMLPQGFRPLDEKWQRLWDNVQNWRDGKSKPNVSTLQEMRNRKGCYGSWGHFLMLVYDAWRNDSIYDLLDALYKELTIETILCEKQPATTEGTDRDVIWKRTLLSDYVDILRRIDFALLDFYKTGSQNVFEEIGLPESIRDIAIDLRTNGRYAFHDTCLLFLYSLALFDANPNLGEEVFRSLFTVDEKTLVRAIYSCTHEKIEARGHKIMELAKRLYPKLTDSDAYKSLWACFKNGTRFMLNSERIAGAYFDIVFSSNNDAFNNERREVFCSYWKFVGFSAAIMDAAKVKLDINFTDIAKEYYASYVQSARSMYDKIPIKGDT